MEDSPRCRPVESDGSVRFTLPAPGKDSVSWIGDFNDWNPDTHPMQSDENGYWQTEIELPLPLPHAGVWQEWFTGTEGKMRPGQEATVDGYAARVFLSR
jgi:1,4-alpha-glucan branching enzyme